MGLFGKKKQTVTTPVTTVVDVSGLIGAPGVLVVQGKDGPMPETQKQIDEFLNDGIADVTVILETGTVTDGNLIDLVEMETRDLLETSGYTNDHVTVIRH